MEKRFITASEKTCKLKERFPEFYFRRSFERPRDAEKILLSVSGLGFYILYINGREITKGLMAPYVSTPDDYCYYDTYDVTPHLVPGENVIGLLLGNGKMNPFGGYVWDEDKAPWVASPRLALELKASENGSETLLFQADERFKVHESPILFDDRHCGEFYDARKSISGWNQPGFDDGDWQPAILTSAPKGEMRECKAEPIRTYEIRKPVKIFPSANGYIYDFGINSAGLCKLDLKNATPGQEITLRFSEQIRDGELYFGGCCFPPERFPEHVLDNQKDVYIAKGEAEERWMPRFTYHGFRYAEVRGVTREQATTSLLEYHVMSSDLKSHGSFDCSDATINQIFAMAVNADKSNFYYFPTDCPHREKNGWTGDAAISVFHMMMLYDCEASFEEWLANIRKAQREGKLPGIVPTAGFGYDWGNGPAWDRVAFYLPYEVYRLRGNKNIIRENADMMASYLEYIKTRRSEDGTVAVGLGDWGSVGRRYSRFETPLAVSDSILTMDMAKKAAELFKAIDDPRWKTADAFAKEMLETVRRELKEPERAALKGCTQTGQAMGLFYGIFKEEEQEEAVRILVDLIHQKEDSFDCGILGMEVIFHVLSAFGYSELAYKMITKPEFPSYKHLIDIGETALPERFMPDGAPDDSHNHHFFGDVARWFIKEIAGLRVISSNKVEIRPSVLSEISFAEAHYELPAGRVSVQWKKNSQGIAELSCNAPDGVDVAMNLPQGFVAKS